MLAEKLREDAICREWMSKGLPRSAGQALAWEGITDTDAAFKVCAAWTPTKAPYNVGRVSIAKAMAALERLRPDLMPPVVNVDGLRREMAAAKRVYDATKAAHAEAKDVYYDAKVALQSAEAMNRRRHYWQDCSVRRRTNHERPLSALAQRESGATLKAIGEALGVSVERARQLVAKGRELRSAASGG